MPITPHLLCALLLTSAVAQEPSNDELVSAGHLRMLEHLERIRELALRDDFYVGRGQLDVLREKLAGLPPDGQPRRRARLLSELGMHHLRLGELEQAIAQLERAAELRPQLAGKVPPTELDQTELQLALAWLRWGETQNCVAQHTSESCLLPIRGTGVHTDPQGSRRALEIFAGLLERHPEHLATRWLSNVAAMTLGEWPDSVPAANRVAAELFAPAAGFPRFDEVAGELGLDAFNLSGGAVADDFDGDGVLDLVATTWDPSESPSYHRGLRDGTFVERSAEAGLEGLLGGLNLNQADYDGDGDTDLLVLRGAWQMAGGRIPNSLLANRGDGVFEDVTFAAGLGAVQRPTQTAGWADYDNDGDLDLYIGNESTKTLDAPCQLFRNEGDGTFVDVAAEAGVENGRFTKGVTWGDYDGDRFPDLYVSNRGGGNRLYHNQRDGTFVDVAAEAGVRAPKESFPTWFWDFDNDGHLDLYVATWYWRVEPVAAHYLGEDPGVELACLYRGDGSGKFTDVAPALGLDEPTITMGSNFGDLDLDGYLDFYLGTGYPGYEGLMPNKMYWNRAGRAFADVTTSGGFGHAQKGHAVVFADLDRDGDTDVYEQMGGAFPGDKFRNAFFRNPGFGNHWITIRLVGTRSNRSAIGARIRCEIDEDGERRSVYRHVSSGSSFGANPLRQTIGLGSAERIETLEVYWPTSDLTQTFTDVAADRAIEIVEGEDELFERG
jgi:hypothetical protein